MDGPVGAMVKAQARHGMRPAHIHFLVGASGYRELVTALYLRDDPHLADDVVFGSSGDLAVDVVANDPTARSRACPASASTCGFRARVRPTRPAGASAPIRRRS
jgi:catechol 1,2-dioxygenase/hydroxyquinol 1,2-dioxygenase